MGRYYCPVCYPDEADEKDLIQDREDNFTFILFGGCGHRFHLDRTDKDIEKQLKKARENYTSKDGRVFW